MTEKEYEKNKEVREKNISALFLEIYQKQENCFWYKDKVFCTDSADSIEWIKRYIGDIIFLDDYIATASGHLLAYKAVIFIDDKEKLPVIQ